MGNVVRLSSSRIEYNAELRLLEKLVCEAIQRDDTVSSRAVIKQSQKVDMLLMKLVEEDGDVSTRKVTKKEREW